MLFGQLQVETAKAIGANPAWLASVNAVGAGIGKMISPQGIAIGCAASSQLEGRESEVLGKVVIFALVFTVIAGVIAYVLPVLGLI